MLGPATAGLGSDVVYSITHTNNNGDDDDECEIDDLLPDDLTYVSSTSGGVYNAANRTVSWNLGNVPGGLTKTVNVTARLSSTAEVGSLVVNQAQFSGLLNSPIATAATMVMP